jgi:hypothetical protein
VPRRIFKQFKRHHRDNHRRNFILNGELFAILNSLDELGIASIPFKGLTLAACAYGIPALREVGDHDLLIRRSDITPATDWLLGQGYQRVLTLGCAQEATHLASIGQIPFVRNQAAGMVELHTALMPRDFFFPLDFERVWERHITVSLNGKQVPVLCLEHLLLVLCAHGTKHQWVCLKWICDIAHLLLRNPQMNWTFVLGEARRLASQRMLYLGLFLARKLLQAPVPHEIWQRVQSDPAVESLGVQAARNLFRPAGRKQSGFASAAFHLRARERLRDGIRYSLSVVVAPTVADWQFLSLPPVLGFLYYLLRPVRLAIHYGRKLISQLQGEPL